LVAAGIGGILKPFYTLLKEPPKINVKKKLGLDHVGREFSAAAIFMVFIILMTSLAFPLPTVYKQAYAPITVTASSLPIAPSVPVRQWLDMLQWTNDNLNAGTVVDSWWDYGYWLTILGNVTTLADNATINSTQIANIGFSFMANETQAVRMLKLYNAKYILVFVTFRADNYQMYDGGGGDNGKWTWMARISGQDKQRLIDQGFLDAASAWKNETTFGNYSSSASKWIWNTVGRNSTIYKLMFWGKNQWCTTNSVTDPDAANVTQPIYFKEAFFSGKTLTPSDATNTYGSIVPLICLYEVDYTKFNKDHPGS
jgi:dolichyl-diphosphooligosaccharide--protein glycosyltransferase